MSLPFDLATILDSPDRIDADALPATAIQAEYSLVVARGVLQGISDYRSALAGWFGAVRVDGHLLVTVTNALPDGESTGLTVHDHPGQRRLYSPASLLAEVEEALAPDTYRLRFVGEAAGQPGEIALVIERIAPDMARSTAPIESRPDYAFEPERDRVEIATRRPVSRILALKFDHIGDFIMGLDGLERLRSAFADAHITLAVGSWNLEFARSCNLADEVIAFDAFPRNSSEEEVDVPGKAGLLGEALPGHYDLAIDLRTDPDTRGLLRSVNADLRAGLGLPVQFPFLDIFLPIDFSRGDFEAATEIRFEAGRFQSHQAVARTPFRLSIDGLDAPRKGAIVWGPFERLKQGRYQFEPFIELGPEPGALLFDIGLESERVTHKVLAGRAPERLSFEVERPNSNFEFRIWAVGDANVPSFSFYGGRLVRAAAQSVLHQSEYQLLLVELVAHRLLKRGLLGPV